MDQLLAQVSVLERELSQLKNQLAQWHLRPSGVARVRQSARGHAPDARRSLAAIVGTEHPITRTVPLLVEIEEQARLWQDSRRTVTAMTALDYVSHLRARLADEDTATANGHLPEPGRPSLRETLMQRLATL